MTYQPTSAEQWTGRAHDKRLFELVKRLDLQGDITLSPNKKSLVFLGFGCDEGVIRNQGRKGAKTGPDHLRKALGNNASHITESIEIYDAGNVVCDDKDLEKAQELLAHYVATLIKAGATPILMGGGHEIAWGHFQGINKALPKADISVMNIDAHLDLRPKIEGKKGSSGTSFMQIAEIHRDEGLNFDYTCLGLQKSANSEIAFAMAEKLQTKMVFAETIHQGGEGVCAPILEELIVRADKIYLSVCLDVFATPYAPGVSAPQVLGLTPWQVLPLIKQLAASGKIVGFDIAELNPHYDREGRTAQLAAALIAEFIENLKQ